jgi:hypothetical protein
VAFDLAFTAGDRREAGGATVCQIVDRFAGLGDFFPQMTLWLPEDEGARALRVRD